MVEPGESSERISTLASLPLLRPGGRLDWTPSCAVLDSCNEKTLSARDQDRIFDRTVALRAEKRTNKHMLRGLKNERKTINTCVSAYEALLDDAYRQFRC